MSGKQTYLAGVTSGIVLAAVIFAACSGVRSEAAVRELYGWEYTFSNARAGSEQLNKLGEQGWEAYAVNPDFQVALKRPKYR